MNKAEAYYAFWSQFGIPAYEENTVPDGPDAVGFPRITYEFGTDAFGDDGVALTASIWFRSDSWVAINAAEAEISRVIGRGGVTAPCDGGNFWVVRGSPWAVRMGDENDGKIKRIVLNVVVRWNTPD